MRMDQILKFVYNILINSVLSHAHRPNIKTILDADILTLNDLVQNMNELEQEIFELENKAVKYWPPSMQDTLNNEYIVFEEFKNYCKKNL